VRKNLVLIGKGDRIWLTRGLLTRRDPGVDFKEQAM